MQGRRLARQRPVPLSTPQRSRATGVSETLAARNGSVAYTQQAAVRAASHQDSRAGSPPCTAPQILSPRTAVPRSNTAVSLHGGVDQGVAAIHRESRFRSIFEFPGPPGAVAHPLTRGQPPPDILFIAPSAALTSATAACHAGSLLPFTTLPTAVRSRGMYEQGLTRLSGLQASEGGRPLPLRALPPRLPWRAGKRCASAVRFDLHRPRGARVGVAQLLMSGSSVGSRVRRRRRSRGRRRQSSRY